LIEDVYFGATNQAGEDNRNDPLLGDLHGDPRFDALARKVVAPKS
jgi:hypothetical protein